MKRLAFPVVILMALLMAGCAAAPKPRTQVRDGADFSRFKTFALLPLPSSGPASDPGLMLRLAEPLRAALVEGFTTLGYAEAAQDAADFTVNVRGEILPRTEVSDWGYRGSYAFGPYGTLLFPPYSGPAVSTYDEQTLIIEVADRITKELVWVGWMKRGTYRRSVKVEEATAAVRQILAEFPARS
jgi:hypothetical protein